MLSTCYIVFYLLFTYLLMFTRPFWLTSTLADVWSLAVTYIINTQDKYTLCHSDISGVIRYFSLHSLERYS
jgi:hypothetical protein